MSGEITQIPTDTARAPLVPPGCRRSDAGAGDGCVSDVRSGRPKESITAAR